MNENTHTEMPAEGGVSIHIEHDAVQRKVSVRINSVSAPSKGEAEVATPTLTFNNNAGSCVQISGCDSSTPENDCCNLDIFKGNSVIFKNGASAGTDFDITISFDNDGSDQGCGPNNESDCDSIITNIPASRQVQLGPQETWTANVNASAPTGDGCCFGVSAAIGSTTIGLCCDQAGRPRMIVRR